MMKFESYMHCVVCGKYVGKEYRFMHGAEGGKYCLKCAADVPTTKQRRLKAVRSPESRVDIMRRRKNGEYVDEIRISYGVSYSTIYQIIQEERHGRNQVLPAGHSDR